MHARTAKPAGETVRGEVSEPCHMGTHSVTSGNVRASTHSTNIRSSFVDHLHFGLSPRSQFSAGARKAPSALKITSRQLFQFHRVFFSHENSSLISSRLARVDRFALLPSPSTIHSLHAQSASTKDEQARAEALLQCERCALTVLPLCHLAIPI